MENIFEEKEKPTPRSNQVGHLHRKLFLLVFAVALLAQGLLGVEKGLGDYYRWVANSFKMVVTIETLPSQEQAEQWQEQLAALPGVEHVRFFSPQEALAVVRHQNPQLVDSLLLLGKNQMPAYFELTFHEHAFYNVQALADTLPTRIENAVVYYNASQARLLFYLALAVKLLRGLGILVLLSFLAFMFLVEAAPYPQPYACSGLLAGLLASLLAAGLLAGILYPLGVLADFMAYATSWHRQVGVLVFSGLLGWTLSKWQKF